MPSKASERDFFLCHASKDKDRVEAYAKCLQKLGATTAFDKYDIRPGQDWVDRILDLLPSSRICVVFISKHSNQAIVQGKEAFLARYLARQYPERHQVIPVFLTGAPPQTEIHGLETTSGFLEEKQVMEDIAHDLMAELRSSGDAAHRTTRAVEMIDEVALRWLFGRDHSYGAQFRLRGDEMVLREGSYEFPSISRHEFDAKLSAEERRLIDHMEQKMERIFQEWQKNDLDSVTNEDAEKRTDEFARRLGKEVIALLDVLTNAGFMLVDHYGHIRGVVANYYDSHN